MIEAWALLVAVLLFFVSVVVAVVTPSEPSPDGAELLEGGRRLRRAACE